MKRFVPDDWQLTHKLRVYAQNKGLTEAQINDQEEAFRLCQFPRDILCWDRAWQRWIRNAIEWGKVVPTVTPEYSNTKSELTEEEQEKEAKRGQENLDRLMRLVK